MARASPSRGSAAPEAFLVHLKRTHSPRRIKKQTSSGQPSSAPKLNLCAGAARHSNMLMTDIDLGSVAPSTALRQPDELMMTNSNPVVSTRCPIPRTSATNGTCQRGKIGG
jgi:hypothetical protein